MNLFVSNLGDQITDESLRAIFATHGEVSSYKIIKDQFSGFSSGFVFMPNDAEAKAAMLKIDGRVVNGRNLSVKEAGLETYQKWTLADCRNAGSEVISRFIVSS